MKPKTKQKIAGFAFWLLVGPTMLGAGLLVGKPVGWSLTYVGTFFTIFLPIVCLIDRYSQYIVNWLNRDD